MMTAPPIVIIGGGPVGLMLANLLGRRGVAVLVLEKRAGQYTVPRAISYDAETLRLFETVGLYDAIAPALMLDLPVRYYDGRGQCFMKMSRADKPFGHPPIGSFYQPDLEAALINGLAALPSVELRFSCEMTALQHVNDGVDVSTIDAKGHETMLRAYYVIACDGGSSPTRSQLGIGFGGSTFDEKWLVVDTVDSNYDKRMIEIFCDPARPALTVPVAGGRRRWEFLMMPGETAAELEDERRIRAMIGRYAPDDQSRFERALVYTFHARLADTYRAGRVLLAGDAAHVMPPFAGQGLNSGLRDAANLAWKLELVWRGIADQALLDSYEQERREHVRAMTKLAMKLGRWMMPTSALMATARSLSFAIINRIPGYQARIDRGDLLPPAILPKGCRLGPRAARKRSGHLLVQPEITTSNGKIEKLDALLGNGFSLIGLGVDPLAALHQADRDVIKRLRAKAVQIDGEGAAGYDLSRSLRRWAGAGSKIFLVRPDRYVAADFEPAARVQHLASFADAVGVSNKKITPNFEGAYS
jgi:3-(3-hydroxy-phenyl)propionate hydroxylase